MISFPGACWSGYQNEMDGNRQQSFIPLTFAEKSEGTTKLRVCGNSAFSSSNKVSFNGCQVPGPNNLTSLMGCLLLFRSHHQIVLGDIRKCFHQVRTDPVTNDLRRVWLRPGGLGSGGSWRQARFMRMSFGDLSESITIFLFSTYFSKAIS